MSQMLDVMFLLAAVTSAATPWTATELQRRIDSAVASSTTVQVPAGDYFFKGSSLKVRAASRGFGIAASGGAVRLWFEIGFGFVVDASSDVAVRGPLEIDYLAGAYFQGTVESVNGSAAVVKTDFGFLDPDTFCAKYCNVSWSERQLGPHLWKADGGGFNATRFNGGWDMKQPGGLPRPAGPPGEFVFQVPRSANAESGDKIFIGIRGGVTLHTHNSTRVSYSNVTIHGASFMAISEFNGRGGHVYENVRVANRRASSPTQLCAGGQRLCTGIVASNADSFHSSGCRRGPRLTNVELSTTFDDYLNIHSRFQVVARRVSPTRLIVLDPRLRRDAGLPNDAPYGTAEQFPNVLPGDSLSFFALNTLRPLAAARTVASRTRLTNASEAAAMADELNALIKLPPFSAKPVPEPIDVCGLEGEPAPCLPRAWDVEFKEPLPEAVDTYALVAMDGWDASGAVVEGCNFHGGWDGVRWKSNNARVSGNRFDMQYFEVSPLQYYLEGPMALSGVRIENNTFSNMGSFNSTETGTGGFCRGQGGASSFWEGSCLNMTLKGNVFL